MAAAQSSSNLETLLNEVTDPENREHRWSSIQEFYQRVNTQEDGPQVALRLLAHKIQSPQEREALQALTLLEVCMNNCGKHFHTEATKFRFLNELIKVLSPKYLGSWTPLPVKQKVIEVLYSWSQWLKDQQKVQEAYLMLKKQGIVKGDPKLSDVVTPPPPQRQEVSVFDDEDKAKLLSRLLKSGRPEDLETANRLIKSTFKEEQEKLEKESRRINTLQEVEKYTSQLRLLLNQQPTHTTLEIKDLYERCDRLRPNLFRLASDTTDNDKALAAILKWNDELTQVMNLYREKTQNKEEEKEEEPVYNNNQDPVSPVRTYHLINFSSGGDGAPCGHVEDSSSLIVLDDDMSAPNISCSSQTQEVKSYLDELIQLEDTVRTSANTETGNGNYSTHNAFVLTAIKEDQVRSEFNQPISMSGFPKLRPLSSLADITVPLDSIKPSNLKPITVFDHRGVRVSLHFTKEAPPTRPDLAIFIISAVNTSPLPVSDFLFLAAVPKTMEVKLQPATGTSLPPYSPLLPPAAISQILLLSNSLRMPVRLRYRLSLTLGEEKLQQEGETDHFLDSWTHT